MVSAHIVISGKRISTAHSRMKGLLRLASIRRLLAPTPRLALTLGGEWPVCGREATGEQLLPSGWQ